MTESESREENGKRLEYRIGKMYLFKCRLVNGYFLARLVSKRTTGDRHKTVL